MATTKSLTLAALAALLTATNAAWTHTVPIGNSQCSSAGGVTPCFGAATDDREKYRDCCTQIFNADLNNFDSCSGQLDFPGAFNLEIAGCKPPQDRNDCKPSSVDECMDRAFEAQYNVPPTSGAPCHSVTAISDENDNQIWTFLGRGSCLMTPP